MDIKSRVEKAGSYIWASGSRLRFFRILCQWSSFIVFLLFLSLTAEALWKRAPVALFVWLDPLSAVTTLTAHGVIYNSLVWGLATVLVTLLLGRVFCSFLCPLGSINQLVSWLFKKSAKEALNANKPSNYRVIKYVLFIAMVVAALFGVNLLGLLDPIPLTIRSFSLILFPAIRDIVPFLPTNSVFGAIWLTGLIFGLIIVANLFVPRFFCRFLCPLGAFLGFLSTFSIVRVHRDEKLCNSCGSCSRNCAGACAPHGAFEQRECLECMNCIPDCPQNAVSYRFMPPTLSKTSPEKKPSKRVGSVKPMNLGRRQIFTAAGAGFLAAATLNSEQRSNQLPADLLRPPGTLPEKAFLKTCVRCGECMKICPTNAIHPVGIEVGFLSLWTPKMNYLVGYCEIYCNLCGQICPTGAIEPFSLKKRMGVGPIKIGTAFHDRNMCLPYAFDKPCLKCEEYCPVSPKAIIIRTKTITGDSERSQVDVPQVIPERCIGCGSCVNACPVKGSAVKVTRADATRNPQSKLFL